MCLTVSSADDELALRRLFDPLTVGLELTLPRDRVEFGAIDVVASVLVDVLVVEVGVLVVKVGVQVRLGLRR